MLPFPTALILRVAAPVDAAKLAQSLTPAVVRIAEPDADVRYLVGDLRVTHVRLQPSPEAGSPAVAFVQVENRGKSTDTLVEVSVDGVPRATIVPGPQIVGPKGEIDMTPEGAHFALDGAVAPFKEGDHVRGMLRFERAGPVPVDFTVVGAGEPPAP